MSNEAELVQIDLISIPVASELILPEIRTRQCRVPTINHGRETALPCPRLSFRHSRNRYQPQLHPPHHHRF
jgi:hypothetical protein